MNPAAIADRLLTPIAYCDRSLTYLYINDAALAWHCLSREDVIGRAVTDVLSTQQIRMLAPYYEQALAGEPVEFMSTRSFRDGVTRSVRTQFVPDIDATGEVLGFFTMLVDLTSMVTAQKASDHAMQELRTIADAVPALICHCDRKYRYRFVNRTMAEWLGRPVEDITGRTTRDVFGPEAFAIMQPYLDRALAGEDVRYSDARHYPNDTIRHVDVTMVPLRDAEAGVDGVCVLAVDMTERTLMEGKLRQEAATDPLTGLANRRQWRLKAGEEVARARRFGRPLCVLVADIDHFKRVNDTYGHGVGDTVLAGFARLSTGIVRGSGDCAGRIGGEEFAFLLPETEIDGARVLAERLRTTLETTNHGTDDEKVSVTCSFGIAQWRPSDHSIDAVLERADEALYAAKRGGRNRVVVAGHEGALPANQAATL